MSISIIKLNVYSSIAVTILNSLTYFILYKLIIAVLGIDAMGLWAIILGFTSIISQAAASINTNIIREVASFDESNYSRKASDLLVNGLVIYFIFFCVLSLVVLVSFRLLFHNNIDNILSIIPLILISIFINLLGFILSSVLDARRLNFIKNIILTISNIAFICFCFFAIKKWGLIGVAIAQIFQAFFFLICIFFYVRKKMQIRLIFKDISKDKISSFFKESWKLQGISLLVLCYEPITKYFLSHFGFSYVAKYEIANKILTQMRNIFAVSNQTLLSVFVSKLTDGKKVFISYYYFILNKNIHWAFIATGLCLLSSPIISLFFLKVIDKPFFIIFSILAISNLFSIISITPYFHFFAQKKYNVPLYAHCLIGILNIVFSFFALKNFEEPISIVIAWAASLLLGSVYIIYFFKKKEVDEINKFKYNTVIVFTFFTVGLSFVFIYWIFQNSLYIYSYWLIAPLICLLFFYQAYKLHSVNDNFN